MNYGVRPSMRVCARPTVVMTFVALQYDIVMNSLQALCGKRISR